MDKQLVRPNYIERDNAGAITKVFCKCCGNLMALRPKKQLMYRSNYGEIKILFSDGQKHVTNICTNCMKSIDQNPDVMWQMYVADLMEMYGYPPELPAERLDKPPKVIEKVIGTKGLP